MSSTTPRSGRRRIVPLLGTVILGAVLALGAATPASAAPNIDPNATGSITVHKFQEPTTPTGKVNNGTQVDTTGLTPIAGVTFTVDKVNVDLTNSAVWQTLPGYTVAQAQGNLVPGSQKTGTTAADGSFAFTALPVGLYLVTETSIGSNNIVYKGAPFLVTMPLAQGNDWLYNVHAYPKNTVTALTKSVNDSNAHVIGDPIVYTLTGQVPSLPAATPLSAFGITDALDARLSYASATVAVPGLTLVPADYTIGATGQNFALTFTATGLAKLRTVQGAAVTVTLNTKINSLGTGTITNQAQTYTNDPANPFKSNTVSTTWGALKVTKFAAGDETKLLTGAEFQIFATAADGTRSTAALLNVASNNTTFTTAADGTFTVNGLKAGTYEIVETKAPTGYRLDSTPIKTTVVAGDVATAVTVKVANTQIPAFALPLTGSTGVALFTGIGVLLVAAGIVLALMRKRRTAAHN